MGGARFKISEQIEPPLLELGDDIGGPKPLLWSSNVEALVAPRPEGAPLGPEKQRMQFKTSRVLVVSEPLRLSKIEDVGWFYVG